MQQNQCKLKLTLPFETFRHYTLNKNLISMNKHKTMETSRIDKVLWIVCDLNYTWGLLVANSIKGTKEAVSTLAHPIFQCFWSTSLCTMLVFKVHTSWNMENKFPSGWGRVPVYPPLSRTGERGGMWERVPNSPGTCSPCSYFLFLRICWIICKGWFYSCNVCNDRLKYIANVVYYALH